MSNNEVTRETTARRDSAALIPAVDVTEDADGITVVADLPGVPKDRLRIEVEGTTLVIEGEIVVAVPEGMQANHAEVGLPRYRRVFALSKELDAANVSAELRHGVLRLRIPKAAHARTRRIDVQVA